MPAYNELCWYQPLITFTKDPDTPRLEFNATSLEHVLQTDGGLAIWRRKFLVPHPGGMILDQVSRTRWRCRNVEASRDTSSSGRLR